MWAKMWKTFCFALFRRQTYDVEHGSSAASFILMKLIKLRARARIRPLRGTFQAKACSRRCSRFLKGTVANVPPQGGRKHPQQEFIQMDTTNILFICGGAFDGLDKIIDKRIGKKGIGFGAEVKGKAEKEDTAILQKAEHARYCQIRHYSRAGGASADTR